MRHVLLFSSLSLKNFRHSHHGLRSSTALLELIVALTHVLWKSDLPESMCGSMSWRSSCMLSWSWSWYWARSEGCDYKTSTAASWLCSVTPPQFMLSEVRYCTTHVLPFAPLLNFTAHPIMPYLLSSSYYTMSSRLRLFQNPSGEMHNAGDFSSFSPSKRRMVLEVCPAEITVEQFMCFAAPRRAGDVITKYKYPLQHVCARISR
jgi:hypothetical protein